LQQIGGLLSDGLHLRVVGVTGLGKLLSLFQSECVQKHSHDKPVLSLHVHKDIDQGVPFSDKLTSLVPGHVQSVETGSTEFALNVLHLQFNFSPEHVVALGLQI